MAAKKTYSRKEVRRILSETLERQKQFSSSDEDGLTEEELYQIAEESGIDKNALQETLLNFDDEPEKKRFNLFGGASRLHHIQMIPGEIDDEIWEEIKIELKGVIGGIGTLEKNGKAYEMEQIIDEIGYRNLSLIPRNGSTRFEYSEDWPAFKILVIVISGVVASAISLIALKDLGLAKGLTMLFAPLGGFVGIGLGLSVFKLFFNSQKKKISRLIKIVSKNLKPNPNNQIVIEEDAYNSEEDSSLNHSSRLKN